MRDHASLQWVRSLDISRQWDESRRRGSRDRECAVPQCFWTANLGRSEFEAQRAGIRRAPHAVRSESRLRRWSQPGHAWATADCPGLHKKPAPMRLPGRH